MTTYIRRKKRKQAKVADTEDRMSNLPDEILIHILSFLSTKEAVRTGILSTRWKSIWASAPTLDLSEPDFHFKAEGLTYDEKIKGNAKFWNFIDRVLVGHCMMPFLQKVALRGSYNDPSQVESWIRAATERNICELELVIDCYNYQENPCALHQCWFSWNALVVLKLGDFMVLNFPMTSTCFPNLKVLKLDSVVFEDDNSAQNLFSSCPVLEVLLIARKAWDNLRTLNITSRSLRILSLKFCSTGASANASSDLQKVAIDASALECINIYNCQSKDYMVIDASSIIKVKLDVSSCCEDCHTEKLVGNYVRCLFEVLRGISNVKFLSLSCYIVELLSNTNSYNLPQFPNLTCLELDCWKLVLQFLNSAPMLEFLICEGLSCSVKEFRVLYEDCRSIGENDDNIKTYRRRLELKVVEELSLFPRGCRRIQSIFLWCCKHLHPLLRPF